ncbi:YoaP domain-containing protein [Clostridium boliviensis]|uniref:YoaP domain-containing protein n=1 Tax=Clostridium boliviensis TaxID=318465 RepID=A0ABU4GQT3_9CLOT|nr:YoaP domain-containing protein [Clostridium boliviensis]MDW2799288.1 YoaP domain-containing protein [Clostridium boliviensis]
MNEKIIDVSEKNLETEHICCAISDNSDCQVTAKKGWLADRFRDGLVFKKVNVRGKCFIEYIPAEKAWAPVNALGYMYINCLWVSGKFKSQGYSNLLLENCIADSRQKGKKGLVVLSSKKKMPFLSDPGYLKHKGFLLADQAVPYYELLYLPFEENGPKPEFTVSVKEKKTMEDGFVLYYSHQCPYTARYVPLIEELAKERGVCLHTHRFESAEEAKECPAPFTTYSLFYNGEFVTNEILSEKKFDQILLKFQ